MAMGDVEQTIRYTYQQAKQLAMDEFPCHCNPAYVAAGHPDPLCQSHTVLWLVDEIYGKGLDEDHKVYGLQPRR